MREVLGNFQWRVRAFVLVLLDIIAMGGASFLALWVQSEFVFSDIGTNVLRSVYEYMPFNVVITVAIFALFHLYTSLWKYASVNELVNAGLAVLTAGILNWIVMWIAGVGAPKSYPILYITFLEILVVVIRFWYRFVRYMRNEFHARGKKEKIANVMVIGAGDAGAAIVKEIGLSKNVTRRACCMIDDNPEKQGKYVQGCPVVGGRDKIEKAVERFHIDKIIIAIPNASKQVIRDLVEICKDTGCDLLILPGIYQMIDGEVSVSQLREVNIEDLLGREPIQTNLDEILGYVQGKVVMVTGGGGSIGSELCRQLAAHEVGRLIIVDIYENGAYDIQQELKRKYPNLDLVVLIASVRSSHRIKDIMEEYHPDVIYHAAAHKHVPLMESSPNEAIKNNVVGTYYLATAAGMYGVERFVLISTDKAVNPTSIMGASKRICEMIIQTMNNKYDTEFVAVRFGNVLGSNGSVIPLFKKQIAAGGPVTVTHPDIIRYFMTIPEAVSLVLQAGAYAKGGEIFVLDMGEPVKIADLAKNLIRLSGYKVGEDIEIKYTGLRPGEKLYEELLMDEEGMQDTANKLIHIGKPIEFDETEFLRQLRSLQIAADNNSDNIRELVKEIVPAYVIKEHKEPEAKRIFLSSPTIRGLEQEFVKQAFDTNWVAPLGPNVNNFETELAQYVDGGYAAAVSAGTAAIHLALKLAGVRAGENVFVSSLTFSATCNPIRYENAVPIFIDSEEDTWNMDPEALRKAFKKYPDTRVVVIVHLYGTPAKMDEIMDICKEHNAILIEDAAESLGATYKGKQTGTFGKFGIYSFNGNKIITTSGGGMLVSHDEKAIEKAKFLATQAREQEVFYQHKEIGYNYRMSNVTAGIGRGQLHYLDENISLKRNIYETYEDAFKDIPEITMNPIPEDCEANYWLSAMTLSKDSKVTPMNIINALSDENIESRPIWKPMHMQPVYENCDFITTKEDGTSVAEDIFNRGLCLPSDIKNTRADMERIIKVVRGLFQK